MEFLGRCVFAAGFLIMFGIIAAAMVGDMLRFNQIGGYYVGKNVTLSVSWSDSHPAVEACSGNGPCYLALCGKYRGSMLICQNPTRTVSGKRETAANIELDYGQTDSLDMLWPGVAGRQTLYKTRGE